MVFRTRCTRATRAIVRHIVLHAAYHYKAPPPPPSCPLRDIHEADDTSMWCGFFHDHVRAHKPPRSCAYRRVRCFLLFLRRRRIRPGLRCGRGRLTLCLRRCQHYTSRCARSALSRPRARASRSDRIASVEPPQLDSALASPRPKLSISAPMSSVQRAISSSTWIRDRTRAASW